MIYAVIVYICMYFTDDVAAGPARKRAFFTVLKHAIEQILCSPQIAHKPKLSDQAFIEEDSGNQVQNQ